MAIPRAVVLGAYGLIGSACVSALLDAGFAVTGVGHRRGMAGDPRAQWVTHDVTQMSVPQMSALLDGADVVVNVTGALQDGAGDDLLGVHVRAVQTVTRTLHNTRMRLVQISAAGASLAATTDFLRTKAQGDAIIAEALTDFVILRPALVLSLKVYGGTALLRAAAAMPYVLPVAYGASQMQTVHIADLAQAVVMSARRDVPAGTVADICEDQAQSLAELSLAMRGWMGFPAPRFRVDLPLWALRAVGRFADRLAWFGWKSPLRTTALRVLADGVTGDPAPWKMAGGMACQPLEQSLRALPSTVQERQFARSFIALPFAIAALSVFWLASGLIAAFQFDAAQGVLTLRGMPQFAAQCFVLIGIFADIGLGLGIVWRSFSARAALGMIAVSCAYLAASLFTAPDLWADPLGPMVKVLPSIFLAFWVWLLVDLR